MHESRDSTGLQLNRTGTATVSGVMISPVIGVTSTWEI